MRIQKLNSRMVTKIKSHEYALLDEIARDSLVTQSSLSDRLGIAVGSVNWYIKRLIHRGWVKVSHLDRTRLKYDLTPEGMKVFSQRAVSYARDSLKVYGEFRHKARLLVTDLKQRGHTYVHLQGTDEVMDILRLSCIEGGLQVSELPCACTLWSDGMDFFVQENQNET